MTAHRLSEVAGWSAADVEARSVLVRPEPVVVVADVDVDVAALELLLRTMPAPTVLVGDAPAAVAQCFDVCLSDGADPAPPFVDAPLTSVLAAVAAHPLAALALVVLLRAADGVDVWAGLAAEAATYAALLGSAEHGRWLATQRRRVDDRPAVAVERDGSILRVTLDRPEVHNAFNRAMRDGLVEALQLAAADDSITTVDLTGAGPSFCSGGDLGEFGTVDDAATSLAVRVTRHPGWWMHQCAPRVVAHLHGACVGAGIELPAFAATVRAAADTRISLPEVGMGLVPGAGGTVSIARRVGRQRCGWLALTAARIDAETALDWGLVDAIDA